MLNVTDRIEKAMRSEASGIIWITLRGDDMDYQWTVEGRRAAPDGMIAIGGANNGSFRFIEQAALKKFLG